MPSNVFKKVDRRYFAQVISDLNSHGALDVYESGLGFNSRVGGAPNKDQRAAAIVNHIFEDEPETDALILDLLDHMFVEPTSSDQARDTEAFVALDTKVLGPRGIVLSDDGYMIDPTHMTHGSVTPAHPTSNRSQTEQEGVQAVRPETTTSAVPAPPSSNKVFVVHGRDMRPVKVLDTFLTFCGLQSMEWSDAVRLTGKTQPTTYEIVHAGIVNAAAVIVIFSPDDLGRVADAYATSPTDPDKAPTGQARQNVILEAGMAFGLAPDRTIFVQSAPTRPLSDIEGFNWVKLNGTWDSRSDLIGRLEQACRRRLVYKPELTHHTAGPFMV
ncbi:TIR domain-containing protein [Curtobacterium flaccumfaciens]|uniref:TIR domain-containing protein n=1 Tax=Curtobacterium flaccumfaciens TaxID=2035 RepID=UPI001366BCA2|nr:TIR domain-containing protein [Curtobacterium flaccumfaciens]MBT1667314.1 nucleotide-binding protein [Curtobacterium flaccumfaciens pv. flaccumfaciens]QFS79485.2 nucleotide-binding protein [Curtobacterium flaccumfaciens pv. flaccumfaciens]